MKRFILPILFSVSTLIFAQNENEKTDFPNADNSYLSFDLTTPIDFITPRYRFGYIHSLNQNWRIGVDLGIASDWATWVQVEDTDTENYFLVEARFEFYHILNPTRRVNTYISGETYFIHHEEDYYNSEFESDDQGITIRYDRADFKRKKYGFNLKFGVMIPFGNRVGMNAYIGAGPRVRNVTFSNVVNPIESFDNYDDDGWWDPQYKEEGTELGFNFALGFKFFYVLR
jgi:hypothetical protein